MSDAYTSDSKEVTSSLKRIKSGENAQHWEIQSDRVGSLRLTVSHRHPPYRINPSHRANHNDANHDWLFCHARVIGNFRRNMQENTGYFESRKNPQKKYDTGVDATSIQCHTAPVRHATQTTRKEQNNELFKSM